MTPKLTNFFKRIGRGSTTSQGSHRRGCPGSIDRYDSTVGRRPLSRSPERHAPVLNLLASPDVAAAGLETEVEVRGGLRDAGGACESGQRLGFDAVSDVGQVGILFDFDAEVDVKLLVVAGDSGGGALYG